MWAHVGHAPEGFDADLHELCSFEAKALSMSVLWAGRYQLYSSAVFKNLIRRLIAGPHMYNNVFILNNTNVSMFCFDCILKRTNIYVVFFTTN